MRPYGLMADLHLHAWSAFSSTNPNGMNNRLAGLLSEIERCAKEVREAGGNTIVMAGDVFHVRGSVSPTVLNSTRDTLNGINEKYGVECIIMPGNHDLEGKESTRLSSAVTALESESVRVINEPYYIGGLRAVLLPWVESIDDLKAAIDKLGTGDMPKFLRKDTDLILHAPVDGVIKGLPHHGLSPEYLAGLGFKRVASGHYHNHKRFGSEVYSIGALSMHTWSDVGTKAGFLIMHPDRVDWRKSHLPEFIDLSQLVGVDPESIPYLVDGNFVRVRVEASKSKDVEAARTELLEMGAKAVVVQAMPKPPVRSDGVAPSVASGSSLEVSVAEFVSHMIGVPNELVAKEALAVLTAVDAVGA